MSVLVSAPEDPGRARESGREQVRAPGSRLPTPLCISLCLLVYGHRAEDGAGLGLLVQEILCWNVFGPPKVCGSSQRLKPAKSIRVGTFSINADFNNVVRKGAFVALSFVIVHNRNNVSIQISTTQTTRTCDQSLQMLCSKAQCRLCLWKGRPKQIDSGDFPIHSEWSRLIN